MSNRAWKPDFTCTKNTRLRVFYCLSPFVSQWWLRWGNRQGWPGTRNRYFHPCLGYHQKRGNFEVAFDTIYVEAETMATFATCLAFFTSIQSPKAVPDVNRSTKLILNAGLYPFVKRLKKLPVLPSTPIHLC